MAETFSAGRFKTHYQEVGWVVVYNFSSVASVLEYVILRIQTNGTCNYMKNCVITA